jgi:arylsulfatase A-like enzyme
MNVIFVLMDTFRRDHMGCYGNEWIETPNLDEFSKNGSRFENAYIGSYPCMPARQDLWTGQLNFLWRGWSPLEYDQEDLPTILQKHNKTSMLITDHYHLWQHGAGNYHFSFNGMELIRGQEVDNWITNPDIEIEYPASPKKLNRNWPRYARNTAHFQEEDDYFAAKVFKKSMDWVEENKNLKDFFLMIDCFDPHEPFDPPTGYADKYMTGYTGEKAIWPKYGESTRYSEEELKYIHALYSGEITYTDYWFGKFYTKLKELNLLKDTMVIVTSDHGFLFGEHNWLGKHARILYQDICRVPLLIHHPEIKPGTVYEKPVQMADLTPTALESMGIDPPDFMHGNSLVQLWNSNAQADVQDRDGLIFGCFGGPVYYTDGEWLFVKKPVQGNVPLYWYTKSHYSNWEFGQQDHVADNKQRLEQWDGKRFPTQYEDVKPWHAPPKMVRNKVDYKANITHPEDELYHISTDPMQKNNVVADHPDIVKHMEKAMVERMNQIDAPREQRVRLGLEEGVE